MGDRWGEDGPPDEAYSRITRDIDVVLAPFLDWLEGLPQRLVAEYRCATREATDDERTRMSRRRHLEWLVVVQPDTAQASPLLVARARFDDGEAGVVAMGREVLADAPTCACDACDEDSGECIEMIAEAVTVCTGGFTEARRPVPGSAVLEHGYETPDGGGASQWPDPGPVFEQTWQPWELRSGRPTRP